MKCDKETCPYRELHRDERMECQEEGCKISEMLRGLVKRYTSAAHGMQTGVAYDKVYQDPNYDHHKHLRVGVNVAIRDNGSLVQLLIRKGVIDDVEWFQAMTEGMEQEREQYEARISAQYGRKISLR